MRRRATVLLLVGLSGCSDGEDASGSSGQSGASGQAGASGQGGAAGGAAVTEARFGPGMAAVYPSDAYLVDDPATATGRRVSLEALAPVEPVLAAYPLMRQQLERTDGFSTVGGVFWSFSAEIDPALAATEPAAFLEAGAPLVMIDVDPASPERGRRVPLVVRSYPSRLADQDLRDDFTVLAQPAAALRPRTRHAFAVTTRVRDLQGRPVGPSAATRALLQGGEGAYGDQARAALPDLAQAGVPASEVALLTTFTTGSVTDEVLAMARAARQAPAPALEGALEVVEVSQTDQRVRLRGSFKAPEFRQVGTTGVWATEGGAPVAQSEPALEFFLSFADREQGGPRPVFLYGHGLGASKAGVWGMTERLAPLGGALLAIDAPEHGSRNAKAGDPSLRFFALDAATGTFDLARTRDNFRQMASDQLRLVRLLEGALATLDVLPLGAPDGVPDLDLSHVSYIGQSLGSIMGTSLLALAPEIESGCLNVGGAGLLSLVRESTSLSIVVNGLRPKTFTPGDMMRFFAMGQGIIDPGDPLNFARHISLEPAPDVPGWRPRHLLLQEVPGDRIVANLASELLARSLGLAQVGPAVTAISGLPQLPAPVMNNLAGAFTLGLSQLPTTGGKASDHGGLLGSDEARRQYNTFFAGVVAGGPVMIIDPYVNP